MQVGAILQSPFKPSPLQNWMLLMRYAAVWSVGYQQLVPGAAAMGCSLFRVTGLQLPLLLAPHPEVPALGSPVRWLQIVTLMAWTVMAWGIWRGWRALGREMAAGRAGKAEVEVRRVRKVAMQGIEVWSMLLIVVVVVVVERRLEGDKSCFGGEYEVDFRPERLCLDN